MSRRVCTKRSSIFLMSCEKKPMTFHPCLVRIGERRPELAAAFAWATCAEPGRSARVGAPKEQEQTAHSRACATGPGATHSIQRLQLGASTAIRLHPTKRPVQHFHDQ